MVSAARNFPAPPKATRFHHPVLQPISVSSFPNQEQTTASRRLVHWKRRTKSPINRGPWRMHAWQSPDRGRQRWWRTRGTSARSAREARIRPRRGIRHFDVAAIIPDLTIQALEDPHVYRERTRGVCDGLEKLDGPREETPQGPLVDELAQGRVLVDGG